MVQDEVIEFGGDPLPGLDRDRVAAWLEAHSHIPAPIEFGLIAAGGSNLTYRLSDGAGDRWVLRRPPVGTLLETAHDVVREARILRGLSGTGVPVPRIVGVCDDVSVTGAPFFVMEYVEGLILRTTEMGESLGPDAAALAGRRFFEALATIHTTDPARARLDTLSRPDGYVERQLRRWHRQYQQTAADDVTPLEAEVHGRLAAAVPPDVRPDAAHLIHGDFHIDNAVLAADLTVKAIFDWELATLGHPIADLAWALLFWAEPGDEDAFLRQPVSQAPGFPTRAEAVASYVAASGFDVDGLDYFEAFSDWKMACLLSGTLHRARRGAGGGLQARRGNAANDTLERIHRLLDRAASRLGSGGG